MITYTSFENLNMPPTSVALGQFDGIHLGHQAVISKAVEGKSRGLLPAVFTFTAGSTVETAPAKKVDNQFILTPQLKNLAMEYLGVEAVISPPFQSFRGLSPEEFVKNIVIDVFQAREISCGFNFHFGKNAHASADDLTRIAAKYGVKVHKIDGVQWNGEPVSSTRIRRCLKEGDVRSANAMLGIPYMIKNEVILGNRIGRRIQFPTINQAFYPGQLIPRYGVYAAYVEIGEKKYPGVTNIGVKPTVGSETPLAETYIVDFSGDLYGPSPVLHLLEFLRPEQKFPSLEKLKETIALNARQTVEVYQKYFAEHNR